MLGSIGLPELFVIFVIALVVFGPRRLPEIGRSLGRAIAEFKRASSDLQERIEREVQLDEQRATNADSASGAPGSRVVLPPHSEYSEQLSRSANGDFS
jgi:sec-independent protein translocase protein TatA